MFKGYKRRVIVVKDTGSRLFDSAYFVVNESAGDEGVSDMVKEANRIIAEKAFSERARRPSYGFFAFALGLASASLLLAAAALFTA